jgi:protocatechuate 3,4-dioxygenase beta subunit
MSVKRRVWPFFWRVVLRAAICVPAAWAQSQGTGSISGTVLDGESGDGVRKAIVTLTLEGTPRQWATERTDVDGHFTFAGLPAGTYALEANKGNEGRAIYGAKSVRELGRSLTLAEGEKRSGITLKFLRGATISGRVSDGDGDPVANVNVMLLRQGRNRGAPILANYRGVPTDDQGEYHLSNVDPGVYYLHADPQLWSMGGAGRASGQPVLLDQYFGGTRNSKEASPVRVSGGDHLDNLDFHLTSEMPVRIHGQILGVPDEPQPRQGSGDVTLLERFGPRVQVTMSPADDNQPQWTIGAGAQGPEHRFEMADLPPGTYRFEVTLQSGGKSYGASQVVDVEPGAADVVLTLAPAVEIQGTLRVEGSAVKGGPDALTVALARPGQFAGRVQAVVGADGRFKLDPVIPGEWNLDVTGITRGYLKSARLGDQDVRFKTFQLAANNEAALNIVVSTRTAIVEGEVDAASSASGVADADRAGILIARADQYHTFTRFYYLAVADAKGKFHAQGIAPGKYKVFALEKMSATNFRTPEAADQLDELGATIEVDEGATVEAHPKLIPTERAEKALP